MLRALRLSGEGSIFSSSIRCTGSGSRLFDGGGRVGLCLLVRSLLLLTCDLPSLGAAPRRRALSGGAVPRLAEMGIAEVVVSRNTAAGRSAPRRGSR
jgi:hypothetical protein